MVCFLSGIGVVYPILLMKNAKSGGFLRFLVVFVLFCSVLLKCMINALFLLRCWFLFIGFCVLLKWVVKN